ncbi:MAG: hypothetical protein GC185_13885 [Alphaproteobacteria bacterium]|nr:hypothetical protein [Alphaproteobacteria bacterium]
MAINESWRLAPFADVLYACDGGWWRHRRGLPEFAGLKLTGDREAATRYPEIHMVEIRKGCDRMLFARAGLIGFGGNSGFQAINIAAQVGARRIVLIGFDMPLDRGTHWHGAHGKGLRNPGHREVERWAFVLDRAAETLAARGIEVLNANPNSRLRAYPFITEQELLPC